MPYFLSKNGKFISSELGLLSKKLQKKLHSQFWSSVLSFEIYVKAQDKVYSTTLNCLQDK